MAYEKQTWEDYPSTNTPITSDRLNHIEQGIYDNSTDIVSTATQLRNEMKINYSISNEVATHEKINGNVIYAKIIDLGVLPNNTREIIHSNLDETVEIIDIKGYAKNSLLTLPLPFVHPNNQYCISLMWSSNGNIYVDTGTDRTDLTGIAIIYYIYTNNNQNNSVN